MMGFFSNEVRNTEGISNVSRFVSLKSAAGAGVVQLKSRKYKDGSDENAL